MILSRPPRQPLQGLVELLWASDRAEGARLGRERILPKGAAHIVIRLDDAPLRFFRDETDTVGYALSGAIVGGVRARSYVKSVSAPAPTVGAQLRPGAATLLLGAPGHLFADIHLPLEDLWGAAAHEARARLGEARSAAARVDLFESILAARLPRLRGIHPAIAEALLQLRGPCRVRRVADRSGYSERHFTRLFTETVGLAPRVYGRVARFGRVIARLAQEPGVSLADLAAFAGYADQPHLNREFRAIAGLSPGEYRRLVAGFAYHVPL